MLRCSRRRLEEVRKHERLPPHRHCVAFHGAWEERDHLYLQTELCATSLADLAETEHSIPEATVWAYMVDLLLVSRRQLGMISVPQYLSSRCVLKPQ